MELTPSQKKTVRHQFDSFCRKVLREEARDYERHIAWRSNHEVSLSELSEEQERQISHAPESADLLYLENFIGNRITNLNGAKPSKWRAMIRTERRIWASDSASLHLCVASQMAMTSVQLTILPR